MTISGPSLASLVGSHPKGALATINGRIGYLRPYDGRTVKIEDYGTSKDFGHYLVVRTPSGTKLNVWPGDVTLISQPEGDDVTRRHPYPGGFPKNCAVRRRTGFSAELLDDGVTIARLVSVFESQGVWFGRYVVGAYEATAPLTHLVNVDQGDALRKEDV